ncbi:MAG: hypothetical protein ACLP5V_03830 [Candidatus Bathyarchaeia archaeon]
MKPFPGITPFEPYGMWHVSDQTEADRVAHFLMGLNGIRRVSILPNSDDRVLDSETGDEKLVPARYPLKVVWQPGLAFYHPEF